MKKNISLSIYAALLLVASNPVLASGNLDRLANLSQTEFGLLAKDFTAAASYKAVAPGEPLGLTGFDLGAEVSVTKLEYSNLWQKSGADISSLILPKVHVHKGLPFGIDVGGFVAASPDADIRLVGLELRYAIWQGGIAQPSLSVRAAATRLSGVDQLDLNTKSVELTLSKGFLMLTPYVGVGRVWSDVNPHAASLQKVSPSDNKLFAGVNANFGLMNIAGEFDRTGDNNTVSAKFGFRW